MTSRVFHWEHLPQSTRDHIQSLINGAIDNEIAENLAPGSDIVEAEVSPLIRNEDFAGA